MSEKSRKQGQKGGGGVSITPLDYPQDRLTFTGKKPLEVLVTHVMADLWRKKREIIGCSS